MCSSRSICCCLAKNNKLRKEINAWVKQRQNNELLSLNINDQLFPPTSSKLFFLHILEANVTWNKWGNFNRFFFKKALICNFANAYVNIPFMFFHILLTSVTIWLICKSILNRNPPPLVIICSAAYFTNCTWHHAVAQRLLLGIPFAVFPHLCQPFKESACYIVKQLNDYFLKNLRFSL